jgi:hypothetical protein
MVEGEDELLESYGKIEMLGVGLGETGDIVLVRGCRSRAGSEFLEAIYKF